VAEEDVAEDRQPPGAAPSIPEPDPSAVLAARETPSERAPGRRRPAGSGADRPRLAVKSSPPAAEGGFLDRFPAPLNQPFVLAGIGLGVIFLIAFAVLRRKGAAAKEEPITPFAAGEPFSVDEQAAVAEEPESAEQPQDAEADAELPVELERAREEPSLFDQPGEAEEPPGGEPSEELVEKPSEEPVEEPLAEPAEDREEILVAEPVEPVLAPGPSEELERRLAQLEERLEEFIDEKDRLGRQVAAQTEELRVQRAAIARTQRVLRDLSRPGEQATEPVPKT
jgi:hypothetical protein